MTNFEKYREEILKISENGNSFAVPRQTRVPMECIYVSCRDCLFDGRYCQSAKARWLYEEAVEPAPTLTVKERAFCEVMECGCIARNKNGNLSFYIGYPHKSGCIWESIHNHVYINSDLFKFITWEDKKPWKVEDLLKLEVEE